MQIKNGINEQQAQIPISHTWTGGKCRGWTNPLRGNWRDSWIFMLHLGLIPSNTTYMTYLRIKNCEKNGGSRDLLYCYWPWHEGTLAFSLATVGAQIRLFCAERKIKSGFQLWNRLEYTLKSISGRNEAFIFIFEVNWYQYTEQRVICILSSQ